MWSMVKHFAELVERTMRRMNFGFAATSVRSGFMASVSRSPQQGLSILSITNAHLAATRDPDLDVCWEAGHLCIPL